MNRRKKIILTVLLLIFITEGIHTSAFGNAVTVQAAALKISDKTLVLTVGQTKDLKISKTTKKAAWTSSKKSVATVSDEGKVTAVAAGKATIAAQIGDKKYTCTVTVVKFNSYLKNAPFKAKEIQIGNLNFVIPSGWKAVNQKLGDDYTYTEITPPDSSGINAIVRIDINKQEGTPSDYQSFKAAFKGSYKKKILTPQWKKVFNDAEFSIGKIEQGDFKAPFNTVLRTQYTVSAKDTAVEETIYDFFIGKYIISFKAENYGKTDLAAVTDYIISSFMIK